MAVRYSLKQIGAITNSRVFFDANVLIYIFWATGLKKYEELYSSAFNILLKKDVEICVDFQVISEIVNRTHRIEYNNYCKANNINKDKYNYKKYRNSPNGKESLNDIYTTIECEILMNFTVLENNISHQVIKNFLVVDNLDFVDKAILQCCKKYDCVLLTNDSDYKDSDIDILTSHYSILKK